MIFTGIQPTGILTLGNYLGTLKNLGKNNKDDALYCIVDLHALTSKVTPAELRRNSRFLAAVYIAQGLHENGKIFIQSAVKEHSELAWLLQTRTNLGELERMTQFKDKSTNQERPNTGLLTYPVLMAADILLYDTTIVPVGEDQKQHLELTRNIAEKINKQYDKEIFVIPEVKIEKVGAKIYSLQEPEKKMSKSSEDSKSYISIMDDEAVMRKKIKSAVTDSIGKINLDQENQPGIYNLLQIYASIKDIKIEDAYEYFKDYNYADFKEEIAETVVGELIPFQEKVNEILASKTMIDDVLASGKEYASDLAFKKMRKVKKTFGLIS